MGIDVHKRDWVVIVLCQGEELYQARVVPDPKSLVRLLRGFEASEVHMVYEAGPTGYGLHDALKEAGFDSIVTPPSLVPRIGGRVKTDHRDSRKLMSVLAGGILKRMRRLKNGERTSILAALQQKYSSHSKHRSDDSFATMIMIGEELLAAWVPN